MSEPKLDALPVQGVFRLRGLDMTRLETFTDAAFAFALTLLVISLEPPTSAGELRNALREIPAFLASGTLLMMFWWGHHTWSRRFGLDDGRTVILSCILVFTVLVYVVPLRFMFGLFFFWIGSMTGLPIGPTTITVGGPEDVTLMFTVYGIGFMTMAGSLVLLHVHAWRCREQLRLSEVEAFETLAEAGVWSIVASTGAISATLAVLMPTSAIGLPGWVYTILPIATPAFAVAMNRKRDRLVAEG
ncbi:MAG: TMEM175 family protein [Gemmatimonadota bacterium]